MFLLWACYLFLRNDMRFLVPFVLSILTKYAALAMAPFLVVYYGRQRQWGRLGGVVLAVLIGLGVTQLTSMGQLSGRLVSTTAPIYWTALSVPQFIAVLEVWARGLPVLSASAIHAVAGKLTPLFACLFLAMLWRTRTREQVLRHSHWALLVYFAAVYRDPWPWYFLWPLGLLCAVPWSRANANLVWASFAVLLAYVMYFGNHAGRYGWGAASMLISFLLAVATPALIALAGRFRWGAIWGTPADMLAGPDGTARGAVQEAAAGRTAHAYGERR
jgi:hypothetical protein